MPAHGIRTILACSTLLLHVIHPGFAAPSLSIDTTEEVIDVPIGTVSSNALTVFNTGDSTLTWRLTDRFGARVVKDFASPWTSARNMRYDATRNCLWLGYYYSSEIKKVSTGDGSILATKNMGSNCAYPYAIEMDGAYLWAADYSNTRFVKFNLDTMGVASTVPFPSGWSYAYGLALGGGNFYATYNGDYNDIYRLNPTTGAILQTYDEIEYFYFYYNHLCYGDDGLWYGAYYAPKNEIRKFDPALGRIRRVIEMPDWYTGTYILDQSFTAVDGQLWVLTYQHDYHITGAYNYRIHLLDAGAISRLSESMDGGTVPAEGESAVQVVFDGVGAASGLHRATVKIDSDGGMREKSYVFVVHAPGVNGAPTANAGTDQTLDATAPTMPITLNGSGSSDPNGDELVYTWTEGGSEIATGANPVLDMAPGIHDITLTVNDMRGGTDTDTVRITLRAPDIEVDDLYVAHPTGGGTASGTVTVRNTGDKTLTWSVSDALQLDQSSIVREFPVTWVSSYSTYASPYTMTYDGTRDCLWVGYYYDDEVGKINPNTGANIETKALGSGHYVYALDMEGADLWIADYSSQNFKKFNMDTLANTQTIGKPSGWTYGPTGLGRDSGKFFATQYNKKEVNRLNPSSGSVEATLPTDEYFYYYYNHIDARDGKVWYSRYTAPRNRIHCMDGTSGNMLRSLEMGDWDGTAGYIYDLSFQSSTQCWMLTYNVKGDAKRWAHLVDLSVADKFSRSSTGGSTAAGGTTTFTVSLNTDGLSIGWYPVVLTFSSNDPDEPMIEKEIIFIVHENAPNNPPTANAGPDVVRDIPGVTAPFILELDGSGSTDPDGDTLFSSWTMDGEPVQTTDKGLIELGEGTYTFELTVDDLRGGTDSDSFTMTVNAKQPARDWSAWHGSYGNGHVYEPNENWLQNWPPVVKWVRTDLTGGGYGNNSGPVIDDGRVYHVGSRLTCVDAVTGGTIWSVSFPGGNPVPCVDEDRVYAGTKRGETTSRSRLYCYNKRTGAFLWKTGDIGPGGDADGSGEWISPTVHGDLVFYGAHAINKYTGQDVWVKSSAVHWERFDWKGRTLMLHSSNGQLMDPLTGANVIYAGPSARNGEGWYTDRCVHGTNMLWTINGVYEVAGAKLTDLGDPGTVYYTQPLTLGNYGWFVQGGHGAGGTLKCVDLNNGTTWAVGGSTQLAVRDRVLSHGGGSLIMSYATGSGPVTKSFSFDPMGAVNLSELGYANQRVFIQGSCGLTCLSVGLSKPVIENRPGTWDALTATATFNGTLINTGGVPTQVSVYWGASDGGSDPGQWEHCEDLGIRNAGTVSAQLPNLPADQVLFYRCFAANSQGGIWAAGTERVDTYRPPCVEGTGGLLLHWPCDQDSGTKLEDISGYNNHGSLAGKHHWSTGVVGNALGFGYEAISDPKINLEPISSPLTEYWSLACWVQYYPTDKGNFMLLSYYPKSGATFTISLGGDGYISADGQKSTTAGYINSGWHHLAIVRNGGTTRMYLDGKFDKSWGSRNASYRYFYVGGYTWKTFKGYLDDVRIYRRALSADEIGALYGMRSTGALSDAAMGADTDDAEEGPGGIVMLDDPSLDLGKTATGSPNLVGVRFPGVDIPRGATVLGAAIQFTAAGEESSQVGVLTQGSLVGYGGATPGTATVSEAGMKLTLAGDVARAHPFAYTITTNTVLDFDFRAPVQAEMQGIGMDDQTASVRSTRLFMLYGWGNWGIRDYDNYDSSAPNVKHYSIPIGKYFTGPMTHLTFMSDRDGTPRDCVCEFSNILVWESGPDQSEAACLAVRGHAHDSAPAFSGAGSDLSSRPVTEAAVPWVPAAWAMRDRSPAQLSPDLAGIVQELVDRPGWTSGNAMAFLIQGQGRRTADAAEKICGNAPTLKVLWIDAPNIDGDALPDIWERAVATAPPSGVDASGDSDGDGAANWHEYVAGTDAGDPDSILKLRLRVLQDGRIVVEYDASAGGGLYYDGLDRYVTLECCNALGTNDMNWTAVAGMLHERVVLNGTLAYTNQTPGEKAFYRLRAQIGAVGVPFANAGSDRLVPDGDSNGVETVTLDGSGSWDPDGDTLTYSWSTGGIEFATGMQPSVALPVADHDIVLVVNDGKGGTSTDSVEIVVGEPRSPGVAYAYYEGSWSVLPDFDVLTPVETGVTATFDISVRNRNDQFGFRFDGQIQIAAAGDYTFYTTSDDGSRLYIGDTMVVNNDGLHGMTEKSGVINLAAGFHPIRVEMFEGGGGEGLEVRYAGPGVAKQLIPAAVLYHRP